ncbi:hypothetical protein DMC47_27520 [Nostoc sp. 3335mG]|nr:hypothetical protein DMC47_27520 [Nostoc sp. 3335mG]
MASARSILPRAPPTCAASFPMPSGRWPSSTPPAPCSIPPPTATASARRSISAFSTPTRRAFSPSSSSISRRACSSSNRPATIFSSSCASRPRTKPCAPASPIASAPSPAARVAEPRGVSMSPDAFDRALAAAVSRYLAEVAGPHEHLSLLRWQMAEGHRLDGRETLPGHLTTSAIVLSPDHGQILLIDHATIGRWLQPGGHYEESAFFHLSARREAEEETAVTDLALHPWHRGADLPFVIDSHDVPGKASRHEPAHVHHDFQYLFLADPDRPLTPQLEEVHAARWHDIAMLNDFAPKAAARLKSIL